ncbi:hypothetical protein H6P81_017334 [Aristolochia fimbriata]|uniref:HR-like lesion-inducer n=1 Tax=Aristolochia fimbriata TaxID=158543 RepID=A0AAV7DXV7_ARIFI|nr:hypothetical protein H6P81_017334 [Aristolochia fimbriata]
MGFMSFLGRALFASIFIISAYQEFNGFGVDGGYAAKVFGPKFNIFTKHVSSTLGVQVPKVEIKHLIAAGIAMKGIGGILFVIGSSVGASLLLLHLAIVTPILYDFYNYDAEKPLYNQLFNKFTQNLAIVGALIFFVAMKNAIPKRQPKKKIWIISCALWDYSRNPIYDIFSVKMKHNSVPKVIHSVNCSIS